MVICQIDIVEIKSKIRGLKKLEIRNRFPDALDTVYRVDGELQKAG